MTETVLSGFLKSNMAMRHGDREAAANLSRQALAAIDWDERDCALEHDLWSVYLDDSLDWMVAYVEKREIDGEIGGRIVISDSTWITLSFDDAALDRFLEDMTAGGSGMKFVVTDAGPYAAAVRNESAAKGTDVAQAKDPLTDLAERAHQLVIQAASLNAAPTDVQRQAFAVRYARIQEDYLAAEQDLERRLARVRGQIDLAATALHDAIAHTS